jgi:hypothetical protein
MSMLHRPFVLLIDDGELDDIDLLLRELGVISTRLLGGPGPEGWRQPERLLVVSGRRALALSHPEDQEGGHFAKLVVADWPSRTLRAQLQRMGFDRLLCRPVHPEALRLAVQGALYGGREQRTRERLPAGCEVSWRARLRRRRATLAEISPRGCRLLVREARRPPRLSLYLPESLAGAGELELTGRVMRYERKARGVVSLSVFFDRLELATQMRLSEFLRSLRPGPPSLASSAGPRAR